MENRSNGGFQPSEKIVYLDNAATTPCAPEALAAVVEALSGACGNPSSHYSIGYEAKEILDRARAQVAAAIHASPAEIFFTGCGSEADNWAVKGSALTKARQNKRHLITSAFEHHAVLHSMRALERMGFEVTYLPVSPEGYVRPEDLEAAIRPDTALVSIMMANNEIGTIQPIKELAEIAHKHGVWFHTDAVQAVGTIPVDVQELGVDLLSMSAHKFNGPKGVGALYCRKGVWPQNLIDGGGQESRHRAGTENVAGIAGMGAALELAVSHLEERMAHETQLRDYVIDRVLSSIPEARLNGGRAPRLPGNVNLSFPGLEGETILLDLDMHGICASTGSACNSDSLDPSHVLQSIGVPEEIGHGSMRFTFGPQNTMEEAKYLCDVLEEVIPRRRAMSCMWLQGQNTARQFSRKGEE
ncbi:MAG TPA: cysteine desulfurase [Candidatus Faecalibacterium intestinipullorum]|nr:cysteine desulfurase [Candidatus Faecalibacterium intestinipullorum]